MISAQSFQWPAGFYHVGESFILSCICMTIIASYRVDDEAQQERPQIKVQSTNIILLNFIHDSILFLIVLLISFNLLCSLGRIHSIVCDCREMKPDLTME